MKHIRVSTLFPIDNCTDHKTHSLALLVVSLCRGSKDGIGPKAKLPFRFQWQLGPRLRQINRGGTELVQLSSGGKDIRFQDLSIIFMKAISAPLKKRKQTYLIF